MPVTDTTAALLGTGKSKGGVSKNSSVVKKAQVTKLTAQLMGDKAKIEALGGKPKKGGPSIVSRVFDVLSRPVYAGAEATSRFWEGEDIGDIAEGAVGGLAGKNKTTYSEAIQRGADAGNKLLKPVAKNRVAKAAVGFGLDVLLDPTTYVGGQVIKAGDKASRLTKAAQVVKAGEHVAPLAGQVAKTKSLAQSADDVKAVKEFMSGMAKAKNIQGVKKIKAELLELEKTAPELAELAKKNAIKKAQDDIAKKGEQLASVPVDPGAVKFTFAGKEIGRSEKVYKGLSKVGEVAGKSHTLQTVNKAFRPVATFGRKGNVLKREVEAVGSAAFAHEATVMRNTFGQLSKEQREAISHAIENPAMFASLPDDMKDFASQAIDLKRNLFEREVAAGIRKPEEYYEGYVHHTYSALGKGEEKAAFKGSRQDPMIWRTKKVKNKSGRLVTAKDKSGKPIKELVENPNFKPKTLLDAKAEGLKPVEDIVQSMESELAAHHERMIRANWKNAMGHEYGVKAGKKWSEKQLKEMGLKPYTSESFVPKHGTNTLWLPETAHTSMKALDDLYKNKRASEDMMKMFDKALQHWKFAATAANPGHHLRNMTGDLWMNYMDGVVSLKPYTHATEILWGKRSPESLIKMDPNKAAELTNVVPKDIKIRAGNHTWDGEEILYAFTESGARSGLIRTELGSGKNPVVQGIRNFAEKREDTTRLAHFIDAFQKEAKNIKPGALKNSAEYKEALRRAAERVRKWNIDYGDLTDFETRFMRRAIPFYTFARKNIPLQIEGLALRPGKAASIPKGQMFLQQLMGEGTAANEDTPLWESVPKWVKEMSPVRLRGEGEGRDAVYWNAPLPFMEAFKYGEGGKQGVLQNITSQLNPAIKAPFELATGRQTFSGAPITDWGDYALQQVPLGRIGNTALTGESPGAVGGLELDKLLNYLLGAGIQTVGPQERLSEMRRQQDISQSQVRQLKERLMNQ